MIDIHSHLLYGVDDGSKSIEESVDVLRDLADYGYTDIILTPHYIRGSAYSSPKKENLKRLGILKNVLKENNININLYLGNEIYIDDDLLELFKKGEISTLNNTDYALIELPMSGKYDEYKEIFSELISKGCRVILAHPERYKAFQEDFNKVYELENIGVLFQSNLDSINGRYGEGAEKTIRRLLHEKKIAFLATDIHQKKHDYHKWDEAKTEILKYISEEEFNILTVKNPGQLIK